MRAKILVSNYEWTSMKIRFHIIFMNKLRILISTFDYSTHKFGRLIECI